MKQLLQDVKYVSEKVYKKLSNQSTMFHYKFFPSVENIFLKSFALLICCSMIFFLEARKLLIQYYPLKNQEQIMLFMLM